MQQQELENLKKLIGTSGILSEGERGEWLQLIDLMNDKQKLELGRILKSSPSAPQPKPAPASNVAVFPLKHIVNLPGTGRLANEPQPAPAVPAEVAAPEPPKVSPAAAFASQLQAELEEKELPSGEDLREQPVPAKVPTPPKPVQAPAVHKAKGETAPPPVKHKIKAEPAQTPQPAPAAPPKTAAPFPEPVRLNLDDIYSGNLKIYNKQTAGKEAVYKKATLASKSAQAAESAEVPVVADAAPTAPTQPTSTPAVSPDSLIKTVRSGLERTDMLVRADVYEQQHADERKRRAQQAAAEAASALAELHKQPAGEGKGKTGPESLQEVAELSSSSWRKANHETLLKKMKDLIRAKGYYEVIFNLEKSPLYAMYLDTGTQVLRGKKSFEEEGSKGMLEKKSMGREEFEGFTDLLRNLQVN